jgi:hypothetical protein
MNDGLTEDEAKLGNRVLICLLLVFTSPFWVGYLLHLFRS